MFATNVLLIHNRGNVQFPSSNLVFVYRCMYVFLFTLFSIVSFFEHVKVHIISSYLMEIAVIS